MNLKQYLLTGAAAGALLSSSPTAHAAPPIRTNLFFTGFEFVEGFDPLYLLDEQNGWYHLPVYNGEINIDLPADGILVNAFPGLGQQAWVGGEFVEDNPIDQVQVWHPTVLDPIPTETPIIKFSVLMAIEDLEPTDKGDFFRWSIYNSDDVRLFSLDFDNLDRSIAYLLENSNPQPEDFIPITTPFVRNVPQLLEISIHFANNTWSAWLDSTQLVANAPVTTESATKKSLGQIRALWIPTTAAPSPAHHEKSRLVFDNFSLSAESEPTIPIEPTLLTLGRTTNGFYALRLIGEPNCRYVLDYSTDSSTWFPFRTNIAVDGSFDHIDTNAPVLPQRFFRARLLSE